MLSASCNFVFLPAGVRSSRYLNDYGEEDEEDSD